MWSRSQMLALALPGVLVLSTAASASHGDPEGPLPTSFERYLAQATKWVEIWHDDPSVQVRPGPAGLAATTLAEELLHIEPARCYLRSYGAWWGLVPTLDAVRSASDEAARDRARGRFREALTLAYRIAAEDALRCAEDVIREPDGRPADPAGAGATPATHHQPIVELEADAALRFIGEDGEPVRAISVLPGETVLIRIENSAGFEHSFHIGTEEQLAEPRATTEVGIDTWTSGTRELTWVVPEDPSGLLFGCTVPGHFALMHGRIVIADA